MLIAMIDVRVPDDLREDNRSTKQLANIQMVCAVKFTSSPRQDNWGVKGSTLNARIRRGSLSSSEPLDGGQVCEETIRSMQTCQVVEWRYYNSQINATSCPLIFQLHANDPIVRLASVVARHCMRRHPCPPLPQVLKE